MQVGKIKNELLYENVLKLIKTSHEVKITIITGGNNYLVIRSKIIF